MNIGVDYDDVLNTWMSSFLKWHNSLYDSNFSLRDVSPDSFFYRNLGLSDAEGSERIRKFTNSEAHSHMAPETGVEVVVPAMAQNHRFVIITARPESHIPLLESWLYSTGLIQHFREHRFTGQWGTSQASTTKSEVCRTLGLNVMIDDSPAHLTDCLNAGIHVIPYRKPWNEFAILPKSKGLLLPSARSWFDIEHTLESYK